MKKSERNKAKRSKKRDDIISSMSKRMSVETKKSTDEKMSYILGKVDNKIIYTSKPVNGGDQLGRYKKSWLKRISKKLAGGRNYE